MTKIQSKKGFTRLQLLKAVILHYKKIYEIEEKTATVKTIPRNKWIGTYNRNATNGKYRIYGHDLSDLSISSVKLKKGSNNKYYLFLEIES